jgi:hypothetical protein
MIVMYIGIIILLFIPFFVLPWFGVFLVRNISKTIKNLNVNNVWISLLYISIFLILVYLWFTNWLPVYYNLAL